MTTATTSSLSTNGSSSHAAELKHLSDRLQLAQVKVKRLARLEASIVDFFMEIMDRTASLPSFNKQKEQVDEDTTSAFARAKRKDEFLKKAEGDPIALLNALRTHLRVQLTRHETQYHEMQQSINGLTSHGERMTRDTQQEVGQWEQACDLSKQQMLALSHQLTCSQQDHYRITRQYTKTLTLLHEELHGLRARDATQRELLTRRQSEIDELTRVCDAHTRERKRLTDELTRSGSHHHLRHSASSASFSNTTATTGNAVVSGQTPAEQQNLKRVLQDYECQISKLESKNDDLRLECDRHHHALTSVKMSTRAQHCAKLEKELKRLRGRVDVDSKKTSDHETELLRLRGLVKERDALIQSMKDEYNKLFTVLQKIKQTPSAATGSSASLSSSSSASCASLLAKSGSSFALKSVNKTKKLAPPPPLRQQLKGPATGESTSGSGRGDLMRAEADENPYLLDHYKSKIEQMEKEMERVQTQLRKLIASEYKHKQKNKLLEVERVTLMDTGDRLKSQLERAVMTSAKAMASQSQRSNNNNGPGDGSSSGRRRLLQDDAEEGKDPEQDDRQDDPDDPGDDDVSDHDVHRASQNQKQVCCTVTDLKRLRQRNQFLEERYRVVVGGGGGMRDDEAAVASMASDSADTRPPRHGSASASSSLRRSSSTAAVPLAVPLGHDQQRSIDSKTMQALQQVNHSTRARPQSASSAGQRRVMLGVGGTWSQSHYCEGNSTHV